MSSYFVPAVIVIAGLSFVVWSLVGPEPRLAHGLVAAVNVLIIACPCALGLATPMVDHGRGRPRRGLGVLIRDAEALEAFEKVDTLVVDKTGTLTEGRPSLTTVGAVPGWERASYCGSRHPSSKRASIRWRRRFASREPRLAAWPRAATEFESVTGKGVTGTVAGRRVLLGNGSLLDGVGIDAGPLAERAEALRADGQTVMFVAVAGRLAGLIGVSDPIKAASAEALRQLHDEGVRVVMATGDSRTTAAAVARKLGLDAFEAEVLPASKVEVVKRLQAQGRIVGMAGDGINDAPALAQAQVGIAMGTGTDVAMASAGVTLLKGDMRGIARARRLSRATMRNIRQNLFFAFFYNALGVPLAAGVLYPFFGLLLSPMIAAAAMSFSSVSVIGNALRLRRVDL
ncbi:MAG: heavy metal translocating P-type ATPase [Vicinamibacteria bacterium]